MIDDFDIPDDEFDQSLLPAGAGQAPPRERKKWTDYKYKVWNPKPGEVLTPEEVAASQGIHMVGTQGYGKERATVSHDVVEKIEAVILFSTPGRLLATGSGSSYRTLCGSDNGSVPSPLIPAPLSRKVKATDVATILQGWGWEEAKVETTLGQVTKDGELQTCGISKAGGGCIALCPYAKRDPVTKAAPACKEHYDLYAWDLTNNRPFTMRLTGRSISDYNYISPFQEYLKWLRAQGKDLGDGRRRGLPSYAFRVVLSPLKVERNYVLNVADYSVIQDEGNRNKMKERALKAKERHENKGVKKEPQAQVKPQAPAVQEPLAETGLEFLADWDD